MSTALSQVGRYTIPLFVVVVLAGWVVVMGARSHNSEALQMPFPVHETYVVTFNRSGDDGAVYRQQLETFQANRVFETGRYPSLAVSSDGTTMYLASERVESDGEFRDSLEAIDTATWGVKWSVPVVADQATEWGRMRYTDGAGPPTIDLSPNGELLLIYKYSGRSSWVETREANDGGWVAESARDMEYCGSAEVQFVDAGSTIFMACMSSNRLRWLDSTSLELVKEIELSQSHFAALGPRFSPIGGVPGSISGVGITGDGQTIYIVDSKAQVAIVDGELREIIGYENLDSRFEPIVRANSVEVFQNGRSLAIGFIGAAGDSQEVHTHDETVEDTNHQKQSPEGDMVRVFDTESWEPKAEFLAEGMITALYETSSGGIGMAAGTNLHKQNQAFTTKELDYVNVGVQASRDDASRWGMVSGIAADERVVQVERVGRISTNSAVVR